MNEALLSVILTAIDKAAKASALLRQCQAEGRAPTQAEIQVFVDDDDAARDRLQAAIDAANAPGS